MELTSKDEFATMDIDIGHGTRLEVIPSEKARTGWTIQITKVGPKRQSFYLYVGEINSLTDIMVSIVETNKLKK